MEKNIERININDKEIILIATAHVSKKSAEQVKKVIDEEQPDSICIELDRERYGSIKNKNRWNDMDIFEVIKKKKSLLLLTNLVISSYQNKMAEKFGIKAGQEMRQGIESAEEIDANLVLADRNIQITFKRIWRGLKFMEKMKLMSQLLFMIFGEHEISEDDMDELKTGDALNSILEEMGDEMPGLKKYLLDERDQYLAHEIKNAKGDKIVAVLGAAHVPGVKKELGKEQDISKITKLPPKSNVGKYIAWSIPALILGIITYTFLNNWDMGMEQAGAWIMWNGIFSALGVILMRGHILTILTSFVAAPISSLNPAIAAGWFAGITEAVLRKPQVKDFESLSQGMEFKDLLNNKVTKILLIVVFANLGSVLGTIIGGANVIKIFLNL
ncbi:MAG: TraB/GumN family protein [Fusobacteriota bacterium]